VIGMGGLGERFGYSGFLPALVLLAFGACGGAAESDLNNPPEASSSGSSSGSGHSGHGSGSSSGSSSGSKKDADIPPPDDGGDVPDATVDDGGDDASDAGPDETGSPEASPCGNPCGTFQTCCANSASKMYGNCYIPSSCFPFCCL
jgi:hypothetical protein